MRRTASLAFTAILSVSYGSAAQQGEGRTLRVANNGIDSPVCGATNQPCRSITQAMDNAVDGDAISVGIGRYGDINGDGDRLDPGDERDSGLDCLICVTKSLRIYSVSGAGGTTIDVGRPGESVADVGVDIRSSNVTFGAKDRGFTIIGARFHGLQVFPETTRDVRIRGNVALKNQLGFMLHGRSMIISDNTAADNSATGFKTGVLANNIVLERNTAVDNGTGFGIEGDEIRVVGNLADSNNFGVTIEASEVTLARNTVTNNQVAGVYVSAVEGRQTPDLINLRQFAFNTIVGNRGPGINLTGSGGAPNPPPVNTTGIRFNNIFGNGTILVDVVNEPPRLNCGLLNESGTRVNATNNFWGLPSGPGADPADDVCTAGQGSVTIVNPVATSLIRIH
jgi:Right handed beta helix region